MKTFCVLRCVSTAEPLTIFCARIVVKSFIPITGRFITVPKHVSIKRAPENNLLNRIPLFVQNAENPFSLFVVGHIVFALHNAGMNSIRKKVPTIRCILMGVLNKIKIMNALVSLHGENFLHKSENAMIIVVLFVTL